MAEEFDAIIIGAGQSGSFLAVRFSSDAEPRENRTLPGRGGPALRSHPDRHQQGRAALAFIRGITPNGKVPAIVDTEGPGTRETRVFDSTAILIYPAEKTGKFLGAPEDRPELLSWCLVRTQPPGLLICPPVLIPLQRQTFAPRSAKYR